MFLLPSLAAGVVFAVVLGGDPRRLARVQFRRAWTVFAALALQIVLFSRLGARFPTTLHSAAHLASYALLAVFAHANLRLRALVPVLVGMALNATAIAVNGGHMPASRAAAAAAGIEPGAASNVSTATHRLGFLGDVFALPPQLPFANVFSIGDLLIGLGVVAFVVVSTGAGARPVAAARLARPLRDAAYRRLAGARLVSHFGDWLTLAALVGWAYSRRDSTAAAAALLLARLAPPVVGGGVAAFLVDRLPKRRLLVGVEVARGFAVAGALAGVIGGETRVVLAALAASGALAAISAAAVPALLPALVERDQLQAANAVLGIAKDAAMALGALGAGVALSSVGVHAALVVDLATFVVATFLYARLPRLRPLAADAGATRSASVLRYLLRNRLVLLLVAAFAAATLATGLTNATFPRLLGVDLGLGAGGYGFGLAALAAGLIAGQAAVGLAPMGASAGRWIGAGLLVMSSLFALLALERHVPTAFLLIAAIGFVDGTTDVLFETVMQRDADPRHYGAVFGFAGAAMTTTMMVAIGAAPLVNSALPARGVLAASGGFLVLAGVTALVGTTSSGPIRARGGPGTAPAASS